MLPILALDVYGTLIDTQGVTVALEQHLPSSERAAEFARRWRDKQLEYSFRRSLMGAYVPFKDCIYQALQFTDQALQTSLSVHDHAQLMAVYAQLPAFPDVPSALNQLQAAGIRCVAFSNGTLEAVTGLLYHAGLDAYMQDIISVDEIKRFKPDPAVYIHLSRRLNARAEQIWLVSSNPFDVIGAAQTGLRSVWVRRDAEVPFDPWDIAPDTCVTDLQALAAHIVS